MNHSSNEKFDYNLIRFLVAIVDSHSMANASEVLDVAPSAVSYAVKKLRDHYKDPLFIRSLNGVKPTALAYNLYLRFKAINDDIVKALLVLPDVSKAQRKIYIRADPLTELWITERLMRNGIVPDDCILEFKYTITNPEERSIKLLNGEVDLDIGLNLEGGRNIVTNTLFDWELILICRENHSTIGNNITKEQFINESYIAYGSRFYGTILYNDLNELFSLRKHEPPVTSESSINMLLTILYSDLLLIIPKIYLPLLIKILPVRTVECDFMPKTYIHNNIHLHKRNINDELLQKIISVLREDD